MSKEDKDLIVVKKNIFSRILRALINGLKGLFKVKELPKDYEELIDEILIILFRNN